MNKRLPFSLDRVGSPPSLPAGELRVRSCNGGLAGPLGAAIWIGMVLAVSCLGCKPDQDGQVRKNHAPKKDEAQEDEVGVDIVANPPGEVTGPKQGVRAKRAPNDGASQQGTTLFAEYAQAERYARMGIAHGNCGRHEDAISASKKALAIFRTLPATELEQAKCLQSCGAALAYLSRNEEAVSMLEEALELYEQILGTEKERSSCRFVIDMLKSGKSFILP